MSKSREIWIDNIKVFACILVALGHFLQSMTISGILAPSVWTKWFDTTVYSFHVPLFFLCSGYLYQKYSRIDTLQAWGTHIRKKAVVLGVPYVAFSLVTWLLKNIFSKSVNIENNGLLETLLIVPASPYWFLYILFCMFLLIPTLRSKGMMIAMAVVVVICKLLSACGIVTSIYIIDHFCANIFWFVAGMILAKTGAMEKMRGHRWLVAGCAMWVIFVALSVVVKAGMVAKELLVFLMGLIGCFATLLIARNTFADDSHHPICEVMAKYTMPVFLMHTFFAAGWRSVLLKIGIENTLIHVLTGLAISFAGPVVAAWVMGKVKFLDFFLNPGKYVRFGKKFSHNQ